VQSNIKEDTLFTHRGERDNENEIGENITTVSGKPGNGI
jgi:hypothetical protein